MTCEFCDAAVDPSAIELGDGIFAVIGRRQPTGPGYVLVAPVEHMATLHDLDDNRSSALFAAVRRVAAAIPVAFDATGTTVMINIGEPGQSVPHVHAHVLPRRPGDNYPNTPATTPTDVQRSAQAALLREALQPTHRRG